MSFSGFSMEPLSDHPLVLDDDGPHHGIGTGPAQPFGGELNGSLHEVLVIGDVTFQGDSGTAEGFLCSTKRKDTWEKAARLLQGKADQDSRCL